ncbi:MAG: hypothetical protein V4484_19675 [Pseudomonadota bacterium]
MKPTPPLPPIDLASLPQLKQLFALFNSGRHLNRLAEPVMWAALERGAAQYAGLFGALGYDLRIDGRGYAWFQTAEASANVSKATRQLALLFMLIFEHQADAGQHLVRFPDWHIDKALLATLWDKNRQLLEAEGLADAELLQQLLDTAARYGFAEAAGGHWRLLPAVYRYLDRFEELAASHQQGDAVVALLDEERDDT